MASLTIIEKIIFQQILVQDEGSSVEMEVVGAGGEEEVMEEVGVVSIKI
jgi:hypothetical protein